MSHKVNKGPSQRQLRVGEQLRHIIAETLMRGDFHQESLLNIGPVTVSEVRVTPDLKNATAYVMPLGGENIDEVVAALNEESREFQHDINKQSNLKFTPRVRFKRDHSFEEANRIEALLHEIHQEKH